MTVDSQSEPFDEMVATLDGSKLGQTSPVDSFLRAWRIMERVALSLSIMLVVGTFGYISLHTLV